MTITRAAVHHGLRLLILLGLAYYILFLLTAGQMHYYIAPRMTSLIAWSGVGLLVLAAHQLYLLLGELFREPELAVSPASAENLDESVKHEDEVAQLTRQVEEMSPIERLRRWTDRLRVMASSFSRWLTWRQAAGYGLLLLPLLAGLVLPETALSGDIAAKKGMNLSSGALIDAQRDEAADDAVSTDEASPEKSGKAGSTKDSAKGATTIDELIKGIPGPDGTMIYGGGAGVPAFVSYGDYDREFAIFSTIIYKQPVIRIDTASFTEYLTALDLYRKQFRGKKVEITGFVYRTESMAKNQFVVGRLAVQCCSADAVPYGVLAKFGGAGRFADNSWLRVKGVVDETKFDGETVLQLRVEEAASVPQPSNQYVYPNYDFLDDAK